MRKIKPILFGIIAIFSILLITSCDNSSNEIEPNKEHITHDYVIQKSNEKKHWKECSCGEKSEEEDHIFGNWTITKEPTETTTGTKEKECSVCHHKETETIPVLEHKHSYSTEWTIDVEPTCTKVGSKSHHCLGCDDKKDITEMPMIDHSYGEWQITKEPTETTTGTKEKECSVCHHKETETIPVLEHKHNYSTEWTIDIEPTCTKVGSKSHHCLGCDDKKDITEMPMIDHSYGEWQITKEPTETTTGTKEKECSVCHHKETETIPVLEHKHSYSTEWTIDIEPTCTKVGSKSHHCLGCDDKKDITEMPMIDHSYGQWQITKEPTETTTGTKEKECSVCHHKETETLPVLEHKHNYSTEWTIDIEPTCTKVGSKSHHCLGCDDKKDITEMPMINHTYDENDICKVCGYVKVEGTEGLEYKLSDTKDYYSVVGIGQAKDFSIVISSSYKGLPVKNIEPFAFEGASRLLSIVIPDSVISIGVSAFSNCSNLTSITIPFVGSNLNDANYTEFNYIFGQGNIPNSLREVIITRGETIYDSAFSNCNKLTSITLSNSTKYIGVSAFSNCTNLKNIEIPQGVTSIGLKAFLNCSSLTSMVVPDSVTSIGLYAFSGCSSLTSITIPFVGASLNGTTDTHFGYIFGANSHSSNSDYVPASLKKVVITGGTSIGSSAFYNCSSLTSIVIPNSMIGIGNGAFSGCSSLTSITIPFVGAGLNGTKNTHFGYIFGASSSNDNSNYVPTSLKEVGITGGTSIGSSAFDNCSNITNITIPNSVTNIGKSAFSGCSSLTSITIPFIGASLNGKENTHFGYVFGASSYGSNCDYVPASLKKVNLTDGTSIGSSAFDNCSNITNITIPNSVTNIGNSVFSGCSCLESITISNSVTSIGERAFYDCSNLTNVYYEGTIEGWYKLNCSIFRYSENSNHFYLRNSNNEWEEVTSIEIPNTITKIGDYQFYGFNNVTSITISESVTSIGDRAFSNSENLKYNEYSNGLYLGNEDNKYLLLMKAKNVSILNCIVNKNTKFINYGAFSECSSLTSITIPFVGASLNGTTNTDFDYIFGGSAPTSLKEVVITGGTSIGESSFSWCRSLTSITIGNSVTSIGKSAFYECSSLTSITIPESVTSIGYEAFLYCRSITNVYYEGTIEDWCKISFKDYNSNPMFYASYFYQRNSNNEWEEVASIEIPNTITEIGNYQFYRFKNVTSITIGNSVTSIGYKAFSGCSNLTSITIPNRVTSIGSSAFSECWSLTSVIIPNRVTSIGSSAFSRCWSLTSITIPNSVTSIGSSTFEDCSSLTSITILNGVTSIGCGVFRNCSSLTSITIPFVGASLNDTTNNHFGYIFGANSYSDNSRYVPSALKEVVIAGGTSIGSHVFYNCSSLTSITIPNSVTSIGWEAFYECSSLTSITIPEGVISIGEYAFCYCSSLTNIVIPKGVTSIGGSAFKNCSSLTSIVIPNSVTSIGYTAFSGCSSLKEVYYTRTSTEWNNIDISYIDTELTNATIFYYSETEPTNWDYNYWHYVDGVATKW